MSEHAQKKGLLPPGRVEVIVVGGGHAGIEAAWSLSRLGIRVGLVTFDAFGLARMSCNPSIGGLAKGQLAREIDALGGLMGRLIDRTGIHFRLLNRRKGPAVRAPRAQADRDAYSAEVLRRLLARENLIILEAEVTEIQWEDAPAPATRPHERGAQPAAQRAGLGSAGDEAGGEAGSEARGAEAGGHGHGQRSPHRRVRGVVLRPVNWSGVTAGGAHSQGEGFSDEGRGHVRPPHEDATRSWHLVQESRKLRKKGPFAGLPPVLHLESVAAVGARAVVLTVGTFLRGKLHTGETVRAGGRRGEPPAGHLSDSLRTMGLHLGRLKTGTPPRLARDSVDFSRLDEQPGDEPPPRFSYFEDGPVGNQVLCHLTRTTPQTHEILRAALDRSPLYSGKIEGIGPRYCPSIEDKIVRFPDRASHQIFLEPEGRASSLIYPNGISTSMPEEVQHAYVRSIPGLEEARIVHPGYAVEYDFLLTSQIDAALAVRGFDGLYAAGQINGTSGYEEAAAQGLVAGLNAFCWLTGRPPLTLRRDQAYIGVLIDDLVTKLPTEPYRMFTSQSEYRLRLRQDNADQRLSRLGREMGLLDDREWRMCQDRGMRIDRERTRLAQRRLTSGDLGRFDRDDVGKTLADLMKRPEVDFATLEAIGYRSSLDEPDRTTLMAEIKYAGYILKQDREIRRTRAIESQHIPDWVADDPPAALSQEARERLREHRPGTLGQASRIPGITPSDVFVLSVYLRGRPGRRPAEPATGVEPPSGVGQ